MTVAAVIMGFFTSKSSLEAQLAAAQLQLTAVFAALTFTADEIAALTAESFDATLAAAITRINVPADQRATAAETARDTAVAETARVQALLDNDNGVHTAHMAARAAVSAALQFTDDESSALTPENFATSAAAAIERLAGRRAVELAASQGVPALPAQPAATGGEDETVAAFAAADAEPDPMKRAQMFRAASDKLMKSKPSGNN